MLVDALRPPDGFTLDVAVGTTFTLDLDALLLATVSFAIFDRLDTEDGRPDPIALLESVRRHGDKITVFAQAGALSGPKNHPPILAYLEDSVVPVRPPVPSHLFHPKVWALRFLSADGEARYRLLILSRNLTFDSSWDTIVQLDGTPTDNAPHYTGVVGDFIEQLPKLAVHTLDARRKADVTRLASDLRNVHWERPPGVRWMRFHPLGPGFKSPTIKGDRVLAISPFLSPGLVHDLGQAPDQNILISRAAAIDTLGAAQLSGFAEAYVIDTGEEETLRATSDATPDDGDLDSPGAELAGLDVDPPRPGSELSGLHAKMYVTEHKNETRLWLGSANATGAAFNGNSEFMVEMVLDPGEWTIERFLDEGGKTSLRAMLVDYQPAGVEPAEPSAIEKATYEVDSVLRKLATGAYTVHVTPNGDDYRLELGWKRPSAALQKRINDHNIDVVIGPATQSGFRVPLADAGAEIASATLQAVTSFLTIEGRCRVDGVDVVGRTLVNARLSGAPSDRKEKLLASVLDDPDKVLRYLLFLLAELTGDDTLLNALGTGGSTFDWSDSGSAPPLLETLLRALAHAPESLDRVADFVDDLGVAGNGGLMPDSFGDVWQPIRDARESMR